MHGSILPSPSLSRSLVLLLHRREHLPRGHGPELHLGLGPELLVGQGVPPLPVPHGELVVRHGVGPGVPAPLEAVLLALDEHEVLPEDLGGHGLPELLGQGDVEHEAHEVQGHAVQEPGALAGRDAHVELVQVVLAGRGPGSLLELPGLRQPDGGEDHAGRLERHVDRVRLPVPPQELLGVELDEVGDGPPLGEGRRVREGGVGQVEQVLQQEAVLHGHVDHELGVNDEGALLAEGRGWLGQPRELVRRRLGGLLVAQPAPHHPVPLEGGEGPAVLLAAHLAELQPAGGARRPRQGDAHVEGVELDRLPATLVEVLGELKRVPVVLELLGPPEVGPQGRGLLGGLHVHGLRDEVGRRRGPLAPGPLRHLQGRLQRLAPLVHLPELPQLLLDPLLLDVGLQVRLVDLLLEQAHLCLQVLDAPPEDGVLGRRRGRGGFLAGPAVRPLPPGLPERPQGLRLLLASPPRVRCPRSAHHRRRAPRAARRPAVP
mmetsp:Transcript_12704/g.35499  ORF Transcript_12704/g.35499 Transcript_12704/m.35499 type:complete len:488 (+) Transcript_12704:202-1665(+)